MRISITITVVAALLTIFPAAGAEKAGVLPKDLPPYGALKAALAPKVIELKLEKGLYFWLVPSPGFPKVAFTLVVRGGRTADPKDRPGMADLLAAVVSQGTKTRSAKQIAEELQAAGGDLSVDATADSIVLATSVLGSRAEAGLKVLADVARNATFADEEVEIARRNAASTLEQNEAEPGFLATRALYRTLFGSHPYAVTSPTRESIAKTTAAELRQEYARLFRADQSLLIAAGDFEPASLTTAIGNEFGSWKPEGEPVLTAPGKPKGSVSRAVVYVPRPNSVQTALYVATLGPNRADPDYAATRVANALYGGMFGSRLVNNIREDKGYTYSPGSRLAPYRETGVLQTRADVRNPVTGASFNEISYELNRMATTTPEEREIESAKRYLVGLLAIQLQSREAVARSLAQLWIDSLPPEEIGLQSRKIEAVSAKEVEEAGRKYFPAWRMTVVAVGEEKVIKDELSPFGFEFQKAE